MAITYVGKGTFAANAAAISPTLPGSLADGDLLIVVLETANQAISVSGWTQVPDSPQGTGTAAAIGAVRLTAFYKFYTTGDAAPTTSDSGNHQAGSVVAFRGVDTTTPFEDTAGLTAAASNIQSLPTVDATTAGAMAVYMVAGDRDIGTSNTQFRDTDWLSPNVDGGSATEVVDEFTATGVGGGIGVAYSTVTTPATLSGATMRYAGTNSFAIGALAVVLKPLAVGGTTYTMAADAAAFTLTGTAVALRVARKMVAASGSYTLTGVNAGLAKGYRLTALAGSFALTGATVALRASRKMTAASGSFALTGQAAGLRAARKLTAAAGVFTLSGQVVALRAARKMTAGSGAFTLTGLDVTLTYATGYTMTAGAATFVLTGANVALKRAAKLTAGAGSFALTGDDVTLTYTQLDQTIRVVSGNWNELKAATSNDWDEATSATSGNWLTGASIASGTRGQGITVNSGDWNEARN